jgi:hypothetical protein
MKSYLTPDQLESLKYNDTLGSQPGPSQQAWHNGDNQDIFESKSKAHQDYWNARPITYDLNKYNLRCGEFPPEGNRESITFLGCSHTEGVGQNKECTWPYLVTQHFNLEEFNLGIGGSGIDTAFRLYSQHQPILKSKYTVMLTPSYTRYEEVHDDYFQYRGIWNLPKMPIIKHHILKTLLTDKATYMNNLRNITAIHQVAAETDSKLFIFDVSVYHELLMRTDKARDAAHGGDKCHKVFADSVIKTISNSF